MYLNYNVQQVESNGTKTIIRCKDRDLVITGTPRNNYTMLGSFKIIKEKNCEGNKIIYYTDAELDLVFYPLKNSEIEVVVYPHQQI